MMQNTYPPTPEQQYVIDCASQGMNLKVIAFAGAGKTSTLIKLAESMPYKRILYLAFNRNIVEEARTKFPYNVECKTFDAIALAKVNKILPNLNQKRQGNSLSFEQIRNICGNPEFSGTVRYTVYGDDDVECEIEIQEREFINYLYNTLEKFLKSPHKKVNKNHACQVFAEKYGQNIIYSKDLEPYIDVLVKSADIMWQKFKDPCDDTAIGRKNLIFDFIKKIWKINEPDLSMYDVIFYDEAQDANALMIDVIQAQNCQKIWVGDPHQQIYEWNGAKNALAQIPAHTCYITQSFRFGRAIASLANATLGFLGDNNVLFGNDNKDDKIHVYYDETYEYILELTKRNVPIDAVLMRKNNSLLETAISFLEADKPFQLLINEKEIQNIIDHICFLNDGIKGNLKYEPQRGINFGFENESREQKYEYFVKIIENRKKGLEAQKELNRLEKSNQLESKDEKTIEKYKVLAKKYQEEKDITITAPIATKPMLPFQTFVSRGIHDSLDLLCYCYNNPECQEVSIYQRLIDKYSKSVLDEVLEYVANNHGKNNGIVLSTIHKSKGCEWNNVLLGTDVTKEIADVNFIAKMVGEISRLKSKSEEYRLLYVAMTRAIENLFVPASVIIVLQMLQRITYKELVAYENYQRDLKYADS